jgi:hypothetical protein
MNKTYCDRCGKEIGKNENLYKFEIHNEHRYETTDYEIYFKDFCEKCKNEIKNFIIAPINN